MNTSKSTLVMALALLSLSSFTQAGEICTNENIRLQISTPPKDFMIYQLQQLQPGGPLTPYQDGTVSDARTGLMWMRCSLGQRWTGNTCSGSATSMTWDEALNTAAGINNGTSDADGNGVIGFVGRTDWRVPNITELGSIIERRCYAPSINEVLFPTVETGAIFWSSTTDPKNGYGRQVIFSDGRYVSNAKSSLANVRLVSGGL